MKKRLAVFGLVLLLILQLFGCAAKIEGEKDPLQEYVDSKKLENDTFRGYYQDEESSGDPLTICVDAEYVRELIPGSITAETILNDFLYTLTESGGLTDVEFLYVPKHGVDREARLDRLRVEIMSGGGPDVFIMNCSGALNQFNAMGDPLFAFPEQAMENGLFLPLDDYMENATRFAEWDKQTPGVLSAGRNEEGQQIIPLTYTLPILCLRKTDVDMDLTGAAFTWNDMLHDPEISPYTRLMADFATPSWSEDGYVGLTLDGNSYMEFVLGPLADFEAEELSFTEEELQQHMEEVLTLFEELNADSQTFEPDTKGELDYYCTWLGWDMVSNIHSVQDNMETADPKTMFPLYSDDGGVTATILSWAAVNRNTNKPDEAYVVIDMLMRDYVQKNYWIYEDLLVGTAEHGIPLHEGLLHPDMPFGRGLQWSLTEENYNELCEIRSQITRANFHNTLSKELSELYTNSVSARMGLYGYEGETDVEVMVHETYETMQRRVRE